jgi:transcriptional regulator with XRE-family HTH domain
MTFAAYPYGMTKAAKPRSPGGARRRQAVQRDITSRATRQRPNRIYELTKLHGMTYADVAERVRALAETRSDIKSREKVHELTINRLASGKMNLTQQWMELLGAVYSVPAAEIISQPVAQNMRLVRVIYALEASVFNQKNSLAEHERFDVMIPDDEALRDLHLYAAEIIGPAMNLRYSPDSIVILSKLTQRPGEIVEGKRYHVCATRISDGAVEHTIKMLVVGPEGRFWLKPESNHPAHQEWIPLDGKPGITIELMGRVRGVYFRED